MDLQLSDDEVRRLQNILNTLGEKKWSFHEAKQRGLELLRLMLMLLDPTGYSYWQRHPSLPPGVLPMEPPPPQPPPIPQPFPITIEADHVPEIARNLEMLEDELRWVKRRPSSWRWALVALYNAVGHTLGAPAIQRPGQVTKLFDAVAAEHPEIAEAKGAVEEVERLRCAWITWGVTDWPVELKKLPGIFLDCLRMVRSWTLM